ncbi:type III polyketide synthase [Micromonospora sp. WMMD882]|uniref:type III polyketide synthase n=1 Tax=Micromonospora sp. WMMD882 TaxID=3015151 RepID=UPI00248AAEA0|nr:type III polyketide synthase [Micromonospora sp. WMMD882]WBB78894.1 type III polyketide synthase [Micromonospora sp. WMMD882]
MAVPVIAGLGTAQPPSATQDELWDGFFARHYADGPLALAERIFTNSGVTRRQAAVNPLIEDVSDWPTERRMRRYQVEALPLGKEAVGRALTSAGLAASDIGLFVVCSCTGYATPGLDIMLARDLGMAPDTQRMFVGHMGCYAALPGLGAAGDFVTARGRPALLLCAELTSLHIQPATARADTQQIVSHALFSDAAVAAVLVPGGPGYALREVAAVTDTSTADHMTWEVTDTGFRMGLSPKVPQVLSAHVAGLVDALLARHGGDRSGVDGWAVHPGGPRILNVTERELGLPPSALDDSRATLAEHGNCSSTTVLLILDRMLRRPTPPERIVMLAFGPGLTLYATLLDRRG